MARMTVYIPSHTCYLKQLVKNSTSIPRYVLLSWTIQRELLRQSTILVQWIHSIVGFSNLKPTCSEPMEWMNTHMDIIITFLLLTGYRGPVAVEADQKVQWTICNHQLLNKKNFSGSIIRRKALRHRRRDWRQEDSPYKQNAPALVTGSTLISSWWLQWTIQQCLTMCCQLSQSMWPARGIHVVKLDWGQDASPSQTGLLGVLGKNLAASRALQPSPYEGVHLHTRERLES